MGTPALLLRPYQDKIIYDINDAWAAGADDVLAVAPTGSGKTVIFSNVTANNSGPSVAIAHRQELVSQISLAFAADHITHQIIGPKNVIKWIVALHMREFGRSFYNPSAPCVVAGVNTLVRRADSLKEWGKRFTLRVQDEAHHQLKDNIWGKAAALFPNARGLGVTATPERADGKGLGRHADGLFDCMVEGPGMRDLINQGYLTEYRVICPPSDLNLQQVKSGVDGDFVRAQLATATRDSSVMGDVVSHYLKFAAGKLGVTFAPDVATATEMAAGYNAAGVRAEVVSAKTPGHVRVELQRRFRNREILQLVNVDLFGEGYDLPAIEVVSMARATQSYALFVQQFGRALRLLEGKDRAIIIDHVGNILRHKLPDRPHVWTLDRRERRGAGTVDTDPLRTCLNTECMAPYERALTACPHCGHVPVVADRSGPEFVDGDLLELDAATLAAMRGEIVSMEKDPDAILRGFEKAGHPYHIAKKHANDLAAKQDAQRMLREAMAWWAGYQRAQGRGDSESYKRFYLTFGVDIMSAQALNRADAGKLAQRVNYSIGRAAA